MHSNSQDFELKSFKNYLTNYPITKRIFVFLKKRILMLKRFLTLFFSVAIFVAMSLPTVFMMLEDSLDIALIIDLGEEESNEKEAKVLEFDVLKAQGALSVFQDLEQLKINDFYLRHYAKIHADEFSPPPEQI